MAAGALMWWRVVNAPETVWRCDLTDGRFVVVEDEPSGEFFEFEGEQIPVASVVDCSEMTVTPPRPLQR